MPKLSLIICVFKERDLLERLLQKCDRYYDELIVLHDGPEEHFSSGLATGKYEPEWKTPEHLSLCTPGTPHPALQRDFSLHPTDGGIPSGYREMGGQASSGSVHEIVQKFGGRFFEGARCFHEEAHWSFLWWASSNDWILRLDADELPSEEMLAWLANFRSTPDPITGSSFFCIWPPWDGKKSRSNAWISNRIFLFNKWKAKHFGLAEQVPIMEPLPCPTQLVLHHWPKRKSYGYRNLLLRKQAYKWRLTIARSLLESPLHLPRWRWSTSEWPVVWKQLAEEPLWTALKRFIKFQIQFARICLKYRRFELIYAIPSAGIHHALIGINVFLIKANIIK